MHPADITAALKRANHGQVDVARLLGVARTNVNAVINGKSRSRPTEEKIAEITGISLRELWPQWYGEAGGAVQVSGDGNVVAGRDQIGVRESAPHYGAKLSIAEERLLRLIRALEPAQQEEVERFVRKKLAET